MDIVHKQVSLVHGLECSDRQAEKYKIVKITAAQKVQKGGCETKGPEGIEPNVANLRVSSMSSTEVNTWSPRKLRNTM
jgi:hypothetical protein